MTAIALALQDLPPSHPEAPCWTSGGADLWTSDAKDDRSKAARLCVQEQCPILADCRTAADARGERFGVWGGLDVESAYRERYRQAIGRARAECGTPGGYKRHVRERTPQCEPCKEARRQEAKDRRAEAKRQARRRARTDALLARDARLQEARERFAAKYPEG